MISSINGLKRLLLYSALILLISASFNAFASAAVPVSQLQDNGRSHVKHVIVVIGDGMGRPQRQSALEYLRYVKKQSGLVMDAFPVQGMVNTSSLNGTTDTLAADTAMLTGHKTDNGLPFIAPDGSRYPTVLEMAKQRGWSTGILTTVFLDSVPSLKSAGQKDRGLTTLIAQQAVNGVDILAANTTLEPALIAKSQLAVLLKQMGYSVLPIPDNPGKILTVLGGVPQHVIGLQHNDKTYEIDRSAEPGQQTSKTAEAMLQLLDRNPSGFLLIIHGGQIDKAAHNHDLAAQAREVLALDKTVMVCQKYYNSHPNDTVVIVVGDHETGKLSLVAKKARSRATLVGSLRASVDKMTAYYTSIGGDPFGFIDYLKEMGLGDLTRAELTKLGMGTGSGGQQKTTLTKLNASICSIINSRAGAAYGTTGHSDQQVPISALGSAAEKLSGSIDNTEIGNFLISIIAQDPAPAANPSTTSKPAS